MSLFPSLCRQFNSWHRLNTTSTRASRRSFQRTVSNRNVLTFSGGLILRNNFLYQLRIITIGCSDYHQHAFGFNTAKRWRGLSVKLLSYNHMKYGDHVRSGLSNVSIQKSQLRFLDLISRCGTRIFILRRISVHIFFYYAYVYKHYTVHTIRSTEYKCTVNYVNKHIYKCLHFFMKWYSSLKSSTLCIFHKY